MKDKYIQSKQHRVNDPELIQDALEIYKEGSISISKLAKLFKVNPDSLSRNFKKLGVEIVNKQNQVRMDQSYFDEIDTEEKAYWLGFIYADGWIYKNSIGIALKIEDKDHLEKYAKAIGYKGKLEEKKTNYKDKMCCRVQFSNKHMRKSLQRHGVTYKKSLTLTFPEHLPNNLINHFIRGYFDGDGSLHRIKNSNRLSVSILGTTNFLQKVLDRFEFTNKVYSVSGGSSFYISFTGKKALKFLSTIYDESTIYLERKYNRYLPSTGESQ